MSSFSLTLPLEKLPADFCFSALEDPAIFSYLSSLLEEDESAFASALAGMVEGLDEVDDSAIIEKIADVMRSGSRSRDDAVIEELSKTQQDEQDEQDSVRTIVSSTLSLPEAFSAYLAALYPPPSAAGATVEEKAQFVISSSLDCDLDAIRARWEEAERLKRAKQEEEKEKENEARRLRSASSSSGGSLDAVSKSKILERFSDQSYSVSGPALSASALQKKERKEARRGNRAAAGGGGGGREKGGLTVKYRDGQAGERGAGGAKAYALGGGLNSCLTYMNSSFFPVLASQSRFRRTLSTSLRR